MIIRLAVLGGLLTGLVGCAAVPRFEYGAYEPTLYAYYKKPGTSERYEEALERAIDKGEKTDRLAPGMHAELGYLKYQQSDVEAAIAHFKSEMSAFPESSVFMNRIIARLSGAPEDIEEPGVVPEDQEAPAPDVVTEHNNEEGA